MPDAQVSRRGLWREAFRKPEFRSRREKWGYYSCSAGVGIPIIVLVSLFAPTSPGLDRLGYSIGVALGLFVLQSGSWLGWRTWGRERFPLPSSTAESADA